MRVVRGRSRLRRPALVGWLSALAVLAPLLPLACRSAGPSVPPVVSDASQRFAHARALQREGGTGWEERARAEAEAAARLEPTWPAPRRLLDDLDRADLVAHATLARRLQEVRGPLPEDARARALRAAELYLIGRLEGTAGAHRFAQAFALAPELAGALPGAGWVVFELPGPTARALRAARAAQARARDPYDRAAFQVAELRYLDAMRRTDEAVRRGREFLAEAGELRPGDRAELITWTMRAELASEDVDERERGFWRGLTLLDQPDIGSAHMREATALLAPAAGRIRGGRAALEAALLARVGPERAAEVVRLLTQRGVEQLAVALGSTEGLDATTATSYSSGHGANAVLSWWRTLPAVVLADDGLPSRPVLRALVEAAQGGDEAELGRALVAAGWFREARDLADHLAATDPDTALSLDEQATRGIALLEGIRGLLERVDRGGELEPWAEGAAAGADLDAVQDALADLFERFAPGSFDWDASPRLRLGSVATVVHPGPTFTDADAVAGRGPAGAPVPGLAAAFASIQRFGVFGAALGGGGPDGTVLRLVAMGECRGEVLGHPFEGTVAWCDGVDVPSRPARRGAAITGAAVHEGYWVDLAGPRQALRHWEALAARFSGEGEARGRRALEALGPALPVGLDLASARAATERARPYAPLGESDRVRVALLLDRAAAGTSAPTIDELLAVTSRHEEGHLVDRGRYLPLSEHLGAGLRLLVSVGFSPSALARRLEYDAQLLALISVEDPRVVLAEVLDAAEGGGEVTEHGAAYRELLGDFLSQLEAMREALDLDLDDQHYLVHQLHRLDPETIRLVGRHVARRAGY